MVPLIPRPQPRDGSTIQPSDSWQQQGGSSARHSVSLQARQEPLISRPPPARYGSNMQRQSDGSPAWHTVSLQARQHSDSLLAWQPASFKPGIAKWPSSLTHQFLDHRSLRTGHQRAFQPGNQQPSNPAQADSLLAQPTNPLGHCYLRTGYRPELSPVPVAPPSELRHERWTQAACGMDLCN